MADGHKEYLDDVTDHGGSLGDAAVEFPTARLPWLDLSTGINPHPYPMPRLPASIFSRLPEPTRLRELLVAASFAYGATSAETVVAAPGTQSLLPILAGLVAPGRAAILSPTYAEHCRAAAIAGHDVAEIRDLDHDPDADLIVVVNPNNPDGRLLDREILRRTAARQASRGGLLVIDEAFMDVLPASETLVPNAADEGFIVLRSFGKFFGLAGIRLGFAVGPSQRVAELGARLGPWAVSGPAVETGIAALKDAAWQDAMRGRLARESGALDSVLASAGLVVKGGTSLFRYVNLHDAAHLYRHLGRSGILVRAFKHDDHALRFGLPGSGAGLLRLKLALEDWKRE